MAKIRIIIFSFFLSCFFVFPMHACAADQPKQSYFLNVAYDNNDYKLKEISVIPGLAPDRRVQPQNGYQCDLVSFNDEILYSFKFDLTKTICSDEKAEGKNEQISGCKTMDQGNFSLIIPYYQSGKNINIYNPDGKMIFFADVSGFAIICGDDICQTNENFGTCLQDCQSGIRDSYCDKAKDGICDPDCSAKDDRDCFKASGYLVLLIGACFLILLAIAAYFAFKKIRKKKQEKVRQ